MGRTSLEALLGERLLLHLHTLPALFSLLSFFFVLALNFFPLVKTNTRRRNEMKRRGKGGFCGGGDWRGVWWRCFGFPKLKLLIDAVAVLEM